MGIFKNLLGSSAKKDNRSNLSGTNIACSRVNFRGSVHEGGDVSVTVNKQYGDRANSAISVQASVHGTGNEDLTVEEIVDFEDVPDEWELPTEPLPKGEGNPINRRIDKSGNAHSYGTLNFHIDRLVIVPDVGGRNRCKGDDALLRAFYDAGYQACQELEAEGSVFDRGKLTVTIDHLIVMD